MIREQDFEYTSKRKCIRKYDMAELDDDELMDISNYFKTLTPLIPGIRIEIAIIPGEQVKGVGLVKAPHYAAIFSEEKLGYEANAGFILEQADLYLSSKGLGSCWVGAAKPDEETRKMSKMKYVINLAFGKSTEPVHRASEMEFPRKPATSICNFGGSGMMQCVRLAPSSLNSQPWFFSKERNGFGVYRIKPNPLKALLLNSMNRIDMGIALCFAAVYCAKEGKEFNFTPESEHKDGVIKNGLRFGRITCE